MEEQDIGGDQIPHYPQHFQHFPHFGQQAITQALRPEHFQMRRQPQIQHQQPQIQMPQQPQIQHQQPSMEMQFQQQHHVEQCDNANMNAVSQFMETARTSLPASPANGEKKKRGRPRKMGNHVDNISQSLPQEHFQVTREMQFQHQQHQHQLPMEMQFQHQLPSMEMQFQHQQQQHQLPMEMQFQHQQQQHQPGMEMQVRQLHHVEQYENANSNVVSQSQLPSMEIQFQQRHHVDQFENTNITVVSESQLPSIEMQFQQRQHVEPCKNANRNVVSQAMESARASLPETPGNGEKRKRGRPRKTGNHADNRACRPPLDSTKMPQGLQFEYGEPALFRVIVIAPGEDVYKKIISFYQQTPLTVCIISAKGTISNVDFLETESRRIINHKGEFEILSLSRSYTKDGNGLRVTLVHPDGKIFRGMVGGPLIAASSVEVVVGVFSSSPVYISQDK